LRTPVAEEYTREQWEIALRKAKQSARSLGSGSLSEETISDFCHQVVSSKAVGSNRIILTLNTKRFDANLVF
jgi:hypothetical protein